MNRTNFIFSAGIYIIKYCFYKTSLIEGTAFFIRIGNAKQNRQACIPNSPRHLVIIGFCLCIFDLGKF